MERARRPRATLGALQGIESCSRCSATGHRQDRDASRAFLDEAYFQGVAVFPTVHCAARTIGRLLEWRQRRDGLPPIV
ncbi:MAG: hypothetical protein U0360_05775 [Dehalococcoidia bacterium]